MTTTAPSYQHDLPKKKVYAALYATMASMFLGSIFMTLASTAMPRIITDLGGFSQYTWVFTAYIITETLALPLTGKLSDMYGRKWFCVAGMGLFVVGAFLCGISQSMTQLIIYRAIQGIGFGAMSALGFIVIGDLFPPEERGKYSGIMAGVFGVSTVIGPTLGGFLTDALSWRWCFFIVVPIGVIVILIYIFMFPHFHISHEKRKLDYLGVIMMSLTLVPLMLALNWGGVDYAWDSWVIIGLFVFSFVAIILFFVVENRADEPIIPMSLFKNRVVSVSSAVAFLQGAAFFPGTTFIPLFFQGVLGASATESGGFMTPMMLSMSFGSFASGQLLSRAGGRYRILGAIGFTIAAVGFLLMARMSPQTTFLTATILIIITGLGNGMIMPIHTIAVQNSVPYQMMGTATSVIQLLRPLGGVFGLAIVGSVLNNRFGSYFYANLPSSVTDVVTRSDLEAITDNPQALVNDQARDSLYALFNSAGPQADELFNHLLVVLREALSSALSTIFWVFFIVIIAGFLANLFLTGVVHSEGTPGRNKSPRKTD